MSGTGAFHGVISDPLPGRLAKPRARGQTMVIDTGMGLAQVGDLMELAADYIDFVKLGFGTSALYPAHVLRAKVGLIRSYGIEVCPGGTFLEVAVAQGVLAEYLRRAVSLGFTCIEVSDGTIALGPAERTRAIELARDLGLQVVTEIGKKDGSAELDPDQALRQVEADLKAGASKVILEGRESGAGAGIYDPDGNLKLDALERLVGGLVDPGVLMWEAPRKSQQVELIGRFGPNVNLGNIAPAEVLSLEALRAGLRGDTLALALDPHSGLPAGQTSAWASGLR